VKRNPNFLLYLAQFFLEGEIFETEVVKKIKKRILHSVTFCPTLVAFMNNVEKYSRSGEATDDNTEHAHCVLGT